MKTFLITGGAGFIGSNFVHLLNKKMIRCVVIDSLTYAANRSNLDGLEHPELLTFLEGDINDTPTLLQILQEHNVSSIVHFAAESHVDNSINGPKVFLQTNVLGTFSVLEASRAYLEASPSIRDHFRIIHISTDEVFGSLTDSGVFSPESRYDPSSPYSASKAASDHIARAWHRTYGLPVIVTNCSNNYGPRQHYEKLIPHMIRKALSNEPLPVYGNGKNVRDWIHVEDHCAGIYLALTKGNVGSTYLFGGRAEKQNIEVVNTICSILDELKPKVGGLSYHDQITFVSDRPGHDWRYAIDDHLSEKELDFSRNWTFDDGLKHTVQWYLDRL